MLSRLFCFEKKNKVIPVVPKNDQDSNNDVSHAIDAAFDLATRDIKQLVDNIAGVLHEEDWRKGYRAKCVSEARKASQLSVLSVEAEQAAADTPRMKKISTGENVNINVPWSILHEEYKRDNLLAAKAAVVAYLNHPKSFEMAAYEVHECWMKRTKKESYNENLFVGYYSLVEEEKEKDRAHIIRVRDCVAVLIKDIRDLNPNLSESLCLSLYKNAACA